MATRNVLVNLIANVGPYVAGIQRASTATTILGGAALGLVAGLGMAVSKASEFEAAMSRVEGATRAGAGELEALRKTAIEAGASTQYSATEAADAITEMAKAGISAADIMGGGLDGALALAAAGQMEVADAAGIASVAMTQFGLAGEDITHVADLLAAGAGKAMGDVSDLGAALNMAGLVASAAGLSLEETTGTLAAFASAGLIGSDAGTSFKTMLQRLQNPSSEAAGEMERLGISMYDANGEFVGMEALAGQLKDGMSAMTPAARDAAMAVIFGSDAVRAANVLYAEGSDGIAGWTAAVDDAGYAAEQAAIVNDNLKGDLERLGGAWDTLLITIGSGAQGPLREMVQGFTGIIDTVGALITWFTDLPGPVLAGVGALTALVLINGPLAGAIGTSAMALAGWYGRAVAAAGGAGIAAVAMAGLRGAMAGTMALMGGPLGLALVGLTVGLGFLIPALSKSEDGSDDLAGAQQGLADAIRQTGGAIDDTVRSQAALAAEEAGLMEWAETWGVASGDIIDAATGNEEAIERIIAAEEAYRASLEATSAGAMESAYSQTVNAGASEQHMAALLALTGTTEGAVASELARAAALEETATAQAEAAAVASDWTNALHYIGDTTGWTEEQIESATEAIVEWRDELAGIADSFVEPLAVYKDQLQQAAQATADSTEDSEDSWQDYADSTEVSLTEVANMLDEQIQAQQNWRTNLGQITLWAGQDVANHLAAMGEEGVQLVAQMADGTDAEAQRMAALIREDIRLGGYGWAAEMDSAQRVLQAIASSGGQATVQGLADQLQIGVEDVRRIAAQYGVTLAEGINPVLAAVGEPTMNLFRYGGQFTYAEGGYTGPGGKYTPAGIVHAGEYVEPQEALDYYGVGIFEALHRRRIPREVLDGLPGYAAGGFASVGSIPRPPAPGRSQPPVSTSASGTMNKGYNAVARWLPQHLEPPASSGGSATGLLPIMAAARAYTMATFGVRNIGGFARRNIAGTNTLSDHALGKAIDIMTSNRQLGWAIANDFAFGRAHKLFNIENTIWQQSISSRGGPFRRMADRGSITQNHYDHIHADTFDDGGIARGIGYLPKATIAPERVLDPRQTVAFERWMSREQHGGGGSGGGVAIDYGRLAKAIASAERAQVSITTSDNPAAIVRGFQAYEKQREALAPAW